VLVATRKLDVFVESIGWLMRFETAAMQPATGIDSTAGLPAPSGIVSPADRNLGKASAATRWNTANLDKDPVQKKPRATAKATLKAASLRMVDVASEYWLFGLRCPHLCQRRQHYSAWRRCRSRLSGSEQYSSARDKRPTPIGKLIGYSCRKGAV
jgi:hypothetical protein